MIELLKGKHSDLKFETSKIGNFVLKIDLVCLPCLTMMCVCVCMCTCVCVCVCVKARVSVCVLVKL